MRATSAPVAVYTLRPFTVLKRGVPLQFSGKGPRKPLALLKTLIALGGENIPEQQLSEALWADAEGDRAHAAYTTTLYRLRKLVGHKTLPLREGRLSVNSSHCWVDCRVFAAHLAEATQAMERGDSRLVWNHLEQAMALYQNPFLEGEFEPPEILSARARFHSLYLRHIERLGCFFVESRQEGQAIEMYRKGLEVDGLAEDLYRALMRCYRNQGRLAESIAVYNRCRQILRVSVGIDPSPETEALHQSVLSDQGHPQPSRDFADLRKSPTGLNRITPLPSVGPSVSIPRLPEGERRQATILISGLAGHADLAERLDPEELEEITRRIKEEAAGIVESHGGIVNQFVGVEVVALFGIPTAHEDDPVRAVRAALALHECVRDLSMSGEVHQRIGKELRLHSGVNSGLIVTSLRDDRDGRYGITGEPVGTATAFAARAKADEILVGGETRDLVADFFKTEFPAKRNYDSAPAYRIVEETGIRSRFEAAERRGFTPFTGRGQEIAILHGCLEKAMAGHGQFVSVVGEAGIGKSRLLYELRHSVDRERITMLEGRCQTYGVATPYLPFLDALRRGLHMHDDDTPAELLGKAVANVRAIDPALEQFLPSYLHLLSIQSDDYPLPSQLRGEELRRALAEAIAAILTLNSRLKPMVFVLEDWHWADEASEVVLNHLLGLLPSYPLMMIVVYRSDHVARWGHLGHHTPIVLKPLEVSNTGSIVKAKLDATELPDGLDFRIHEHTGGNPFFIEEVCNALVGDGVVQEKERSTVLARRFERLRLPGTVQAVIRTRVDRQDPASQEVLRLASVIGREFDTSLLERVHGDQVGLAGILEELTAQDLIQQIRVLPEAEYLFKHVLTQVVVYETLLIQQRRFLHGKVARAIESLYADRLEEQYEALAHHYGNSDDTQQAIEYMELAGDKAARYFSLVEARRHYRAAIEVLDSMEPTDERKRRRIDLNLKWASVTNLAPSVDHVEFLETSLSYAQDLGDPSCIARTSYWIGRIFFNLGNLVEAVARFERCLDMGRAQNDEELYALSYTIIGRICLWTLEHSKGIAYLEEGIPLLERAGQQEEAVFAMSFLAMFYGSTGRFDKAFQLGAKALKKAISLKNPTTESYVHFAVGEVHYRLGNWEAAAASSARSTTISRRIGNPNVSVTAMPVEAYATFMWRDRGKGIYLANQCLAIFESSGSHLGISLTYGVLADMHCQVGDLEKAVAHAHHALEQRPLGDRRGELFAHLALAAAGVKVTPPDWSQAHAHMEECIRRAQEVGARPDLAVAYFRYAEILHHEGDVEQAGNYLSKAAALFSAMGMIWWLGQTDELRQTLETDGALSNTGRAKEN